MHPEPIRIDSVLGIFLETITARDWCKSALSSQIAVQMMSCDEKCLFRALLSQDVKFSGPATSLLQQLLQAGISLRLGWPRGQGEAVDEWLGRRFYLSASRNFSSNERFVSLVSSQLGRHGGKLPNWPSLVDAALQNARRDRERPLILPGTSLSEATQQFSMRADLQSLSVQFDDRTTIGHWLNDLLNELELAYAERSLESTAQRCLSKLRLSPPASQPSATELDTLPLQDRVAFALADRIIAIHVRSNGKIAELAERRLADDRFPTGSVYIASTIGQHSSRQPDFESWLERGAVGWLLQEPTQQPDHCLAHCRKYASDPFTQSLCWQMPAPWLENSSNDAEWPYLAHCTRGNSGPLPDETLEQFRDRAWGAGSIPNSHPLSTLQQILNDQRVRGSPWLTRSQQPCVSFSAVPLAELLSRRQFRSHLGRWDWEPYGVLVRRDVLQQFGARPVVYGDDAGYKLLAEDDKPYFQPLGKKNSRNQHGNNQDWSVEREWRLFGDLDLTELLCDSIVVFVATKKEAQQVARRCQWPVIWREG